MTSLAIELSNNLRLSNIPSRLRKHLTESLAFPNPKWLENQRLGRWNRGTPKELRFYDKIGNDRLWIPRGYIRSLIHVCRRHKLPYTLSDKRRKFHPKDFSFHGSLKPFQTMATNAMLKKDFGVLCAPTGAGKTVIALAIMAQRRQPTLIVVHTKELAFQWIDRISTFLDLPEDQIGMIGAGRHDTGRAITIALVQSLYKCAEEVAKGVGFLIVDECHRCPSRTFTEAVSAFDSYYMLGLSATPYRRDQLSKLIFWYLGDQHYRIPESPLVKDGHILPAEIIFRPTEFKTGFDPVQEYSKMLSELTADTQRNLMIVEDIAKEAQENKGVCLVLSDRRAHCENLKALLKYRHRLDAALLTGDVPLDQRRKILEEIAEGRPNVLIATGQLIGEGFDCGHLSTLFLTTPIKFSGRVLQYMGRVLRPAPGKSKAKIFDYVDERISVLASAARARQRVYER